MSLSSSTIVKALSKDAFSSSTSFCFFARSSFETIPFACFCPKTIVSNLLSCCPVPLRSVSSRNFVRARARVCVRERESQAVAHKPEGKRANLQCIKLRARNHVGHLFPKTFCFVQRGLQRRAIHHARHLRLTHSVSIRLKQSLDELHIAHIVNVTNANRITRIMGDFF